MIGEGWLQMALSPGPLHYQQTAARLHGHFQKSSTPRKSINRPRSLKQVSVSSPKHSGSHEKTMMHENNAVIFRLSSEVQSCVFGGSSPGGVGGTAAICHHSTFRSPVSLLPLCGPVPMGPPLPADERAPVGLARTCWVTAVTAHSVLERNHPTAKR